MKFLPYNQFERPNAFINMRVMWDNQANMDALGNISSGIPSASNALLAGQQNKLDSLNSSISNYYNDPKNSLTNMATTMGNQMGLPQLQANANQINTQVANLPFTERDASRGFDVNNNQLNRVIGQRITDLTPAMTTANNALDSAQNNLTRNMAYAGQDVANKGIPYQMQQAATLDQMARQSTMFTAANQQELDGYIAKMNAGITLSEGEANRANQLAIAEKGYENNLAVAKQQQQIIPIPGYGVYNAGANNGQGVLYGGLNGVTNTGLLTYK